MDDLAAEMAMSKKTLYVHFQSKQELLEAVMDQKFANLEAEMDAIQSGAPADFALTLHQLLTCMRRHAQEVTPTFLRDLSKDNPRLIERIKARRRVVIGRTFGRIIRVGQKAGAVRNDISADLLVEILLGLAESVAAPEKLATRGRSISKVLSAILAVFLEGILIEKGAR